MKGGRRESIGNEHLMGLFDINGIEKVLSLKRFKFSL